MKYKRTDNRRFGGLFGNSRRNGRILLEALEERQLLSSDVLQWGGVQNGNAVYATETTLTPANVNSSQFGKLDTLSLPGGTTDQVYAQPLIVHGVNVTGQGANNGLHDLVIIATEANNVYAFDASTNALVWSLNVGTPIPAGVAGGPNANNITGEDGITGTPVIDSATGTMYLDSIQEIGGTTAPKFAHVVMAINIASGIIIHSTIIGAENTTIPSAIQISVLGNLIDSAPATTGTQVYFNPGTQLQRPGLTILNGDVYIAYGAYGNTNPYDGWILGFSETDVALTSVFADVPNTDSTHTASGSNGSIWQSGVEISTDGTYLYVVTGNGVMNSSVSDYGESALKLQPDSNTSQDTATGQTTNGYGIHLVDYFAPWNATFLGEYKSTTKGDATNSGDLDLGTSGALLLPDQPGPFPHEEIMVSKEGVIYVVNRDDMGGQNTGTSDSQIIQELSLDGKGMWGNPAYFNGIVYFHEASGVEMAYSLSPTTGLLSPQPIFVGFITAGSEGSSQVISYDGTDSSTAVLWEIDSSSSSLRAYDPTTLQQVFSGGLGGTADHFTVPMISDGQVWVGGKGFISVYGELPSPLATPPGAPTGLSVSTLTGGQLALNWSATAVTNETAFLIERSTDNVAFSQIASVGIDVTTYVDATVFPGTLYYYRVRATNGPSSNSVYTSSVSGTASILSVAGNSYSFDAGSGTTVADPVGANTGTFNGTVTKPTWVAGFNGTGDALFFDGANGAASDSSATITGAVVTLKNAVNGYLGGTSASGATLDFWINTTQTGNDEPTLAPAIFGVTKLKGATSFPPTSANTQDGGADMRWGYIDASGHIGISVDGYKATSNALDTFGVVSTTAINDGQWHNIALTRNVATGLLQVYVDGLLQGSFYGDTGSKATSFNLMGTQVEENSNGTVTGHEYFIGTLDNLNIYNQVLGPGEIALLAGVLPSNVSLAGYGSVYLQVDANGLLAAYQGTSAGGTLIGARPVSQVQSLTLQGPGSGTTAFVLNTASALSFSSLSLTGGATLQLTSSSPQLLTLGQLSIDASSLLDIGSNYLDIHTNNSTTAYNALVPQLSAVRNAGSWVGTGLGTSTAAANQGLAVVQNDQLPTPYATWEGQTVGLTDLLIAKTWNGDALLTGHVNTDDFLQIDAGYLFHGVGYVNGDFDYSGSVTAADFVLINAAYGAQPPLSTGDALSAQPVEITSSSTGGQPAVAGADSAAPIPAPAIIPPIVLESGLSVAPVVQTPVESSSSAAETGVVPAAVFAPWVPPVASEPVAQPENLLARRHILFFSPLAIPIGTFAPAAIAGAAVTNNVTGLDFLVHFTPYPRKAQYWTQTPLGRRVV